MIDWSTVLIALLIPLGMAIPAVAAGLYQMRQERIWAEEKRRTASRLTPTK